MVYLVRISAARSYHKPKFGSLTMKHMKFIKYFNKLPKNSC